ncbi:MAG: alpha/beta hydrolase [Acidimicrobiia bacterium]|nr:alpha/beta hydrolase [Acidimicrobiia bacterium]
MSVETLPLGESFTWHHPESLQRQGHQPQSYEAEIRWDCFGEGPPVILCHGTPWSSFVWRRIVHELAPHWSVYVWDMVGYGRSDKPDGDVSLRTQGELLAALIEEWKLETPHVVAHDVGGAVALRSHLLHATPFASLTMIDVVALRPWGSPFFKLVAEHADVFASLPPNLHRVLVREYISGASHQGLAADVLDALVEPWIDAGQAAFYRQIAQADERFTAELEGRFGEIKIPTLIVWGTNDEWIPVDRADRLAAAIAGSRKHLIRGAGHLVQEDAPAELARVLAEWLHTHR